jgi:phage gp45-like
MFASSIGEAIAYLRDYVDIKIAQATARLFHFTYYSGSSATGNQDQVVCDQNDQNSGSYAVQRMQHFGFRSRPPKNVWAIRLGNHEAASNSVVIAEDSDRYGPGDLEDGEVALYNKTTGTEIRLDEEGNVIITTPAGKTIQLNGSDQQLLMADEFMADFTDFVNRVLAVISSNCINGAPLTSYPTYAAALAAFATQLGVANSYRSDKVQNG